MSRKFSLNIPGKERPNLLSLFHTYIVRKVKEERESWEKLYRLHRNRHRSMVYDDYGSEYEEEMEQLRRFYGGAFPRSGGYILNPLDEDDEDEWDDDDFDDIYSNYDDYLVGDDGEIIFPNSGVAQSANDDPDRTLRPGEYRRSRQDMDDYWNKMSKFNERGKHKHTKHRGSRGRKKAKVVDINQPYNANYIDNDGDALENCSVYFYEDYHDKYSRIEFNNLFEFDQYCNEMGFTVPAYVAEAIAYAPISHCCLSPGAKEQGVLEVMREETYGDMFYEACETSELSNT